MQDKTATRRPSGRILFVVLLLLLWWPLSVPGAGEALAQATSTAAARGDSVYIAILPGFSFSSDQGLYGAVKLNRYDFRGGYEPFGTYNEIKLAASTRRLVAGEYFGDLTQTMGTGLRTTLHLLAFRFPQDTWFGRGNDSDFEPGLWENDYYFFTSVSVSGSIRVRIPLNGRQRSNRFDVVPSAGFSYEKPTFDEVTLMEDEPPVGITGGWFNTFGLGLLRDTRNSEFRPSAGYRAEIRLDVSNRALGSGYNGAIVRANVSRFIGFRLVTDHVLALQLVGNQALGSVPYWRQPSLGGEYTMRGFPYRRFLDNASVHYTAEIRTWFFHHEPSGIRLGGHLFADGGRVFDRITTEELLRGHHLTWGFGGTLSPGRPDVFFRGDVGISREMVRIYAGIGYAF